jgi:hypothetical protein
VIHNDTRSTKHQIHNKIYLVHWNQPDGVLLLLVAVNDPLHTYLTTFSKQNPHCCRYRLFVNDKKDAQISSGGLFCASSFLNALTKTAKNVTRADIQFTLSWSKHSFGRATISSNIVVQHNHTSCFHYLFGPVVTQFYCT